MTIKSILICAGFSSRMGKLKPLLLYEEIPLIINIILKLYKVSDEIIIVLGYQSEKIKNETKKFLDKEEYFHLKDKVRFVINLEYEKGMFTSLQKGLTEIKDTDWIIYHFIDQPGIPLEFYKDFINQIEDNNNWIQPSFNRMKAHPILLRNDVCEKINSESEFSNLKNISQSSFIKKKIWECNYPEVLIDIDTPEDYKFLISEKV